MLPEPRLVYTASCNVCIMWMSWVISTTKLQSSSLATKQNSENLFLLKMLFAPQGGVCRERFPRSKQGSMGGEKD